MLRLVWRWLVGGIFLLPAAPFLVCQNLDLASAAAQFAANITQHSLPGAVSVTINNRSSLKDEDVPTLRAELLRQLQARGWRARRADEGGAAINVTLSESFRDYVWTAEIIAGESRAVAVFEMPKPRQQVSIANERVTLSRTLLISSEDVLLDVALLEGKIGEGAHMLALTPTSIQLYRMQSAQWHLLQTQPLGRASKASHDLRGRILVQQASMLDAYLPGLHCSGVVTQTVSFNCAQSDDPWPIGGDRALLAFYATNRNYFNGVMSGANAQNRNVEPFYSAALLSDRVIYSGVDGQIRAVSTSQSPSILPARWGNSMTAVQSNCLPDLVLASAVGDFRHADSITAFDVSNSQFSAVSQPMLFSGPVLSMTTSPDRQQTTAVVESSFGGYEAYLLTARCAF
ncbi:MAG TPA: hypothetical protein VH196_01480 [Terriglobales bacterium]|nr:hypothetical protein [Terriglobales bacterium]